MSSKVADLPLATTAVGAKLYADEGGIDARVEGGAANGLATLDGSGKIPTSQLPSSILGQVEYQGTWDASAGTPPTVSPEKGWYYVVSVQGSTSLGGITDWKVGDWAIYNGAAWQKVDNTDAVQSVAGLTGAISVGDLKTALDYQGDQIDSNAIVGQPTVDAALASLRSDLDGASGEIGALDTNKVAKAGDTMTGALNEAKSVDIASAATTDLAGAGGNFVHITGTTTITALGTAPAGARRVVRFSGALTLTHNASSLILPTGANITTAANDCAVFVSEGSGNWRCVSYQRADGTALASAGGGLTGFTATLNTASPNNTRNASALVPSGGTTDQDGVYSRKGQGAISGVIPDATSTGGNKRGPNAVDWQLDRTGATQVASGTASGILAGAQNTASNVCAVVVAGFGNTCAGEYGGIVTGDSNSISSGAQYNFIGGGRFNAISASAYGSVIAGGQTNAINNSAVYANIAGGLQNTVQANYGHITGGQSITITGQYSRGGGYQALDRGVQGTDVWSSGGFSAAGQAQNRRVQLRSDTTNATTEAATSTNAAASATNQLVLADNSALHVTGRAVVRENATGDCAAYSIKALVRRGSGAGSTTVVGQSVTTEYNDAGAATWALAVVADTTNGALRINVTGEAAHNLRWVVELTAIEVVG